ncbi:MAG: MATE family multidrug resistance protein [Bacteroidia bacterium]|jgi:MATE family multidrug resistance protein
MPLVAGNVGLVLMGLIDTAMVGQLGYIPLAASGISNTIFFIVTIFGIGILMVFSANIAAEQTRKNAETESLIGASLVINILVSIFTYIVLILSYHYFGLFGQSGAVETAALPYLKLIIYSSWPLFLFLTFKSVSDGHNLTMAAMVATLSALVLNVFLNWVLIFGKLGFPAYGLVGAGYATLISRSYMAIFLLLFCVYHRKVVFDWSTFRTKIYAKHIKTLLALGIPSGGQFFFEVSAFAGAAIIAGWIGEHELAAHTIAIQLASFTYMFAGGISVAGMIKTGESWAQNKYQKTLDIGRNTFSLITVFMAISALAFVVFRGPMVALFATNTEVIVIASELIILAAFFQFFDGIQAVSLGLLRGMGDTKIPSYITLLVYWIIALPLAYYLGIHTPLKMTGVWIALTLALILASVFLYARFIQITKRKIQH